MLTRLRPLIPRLSHRQAASRRLVTLVAAVSFVAVPLVGAGCSTTGEPAASSVAPDTTTAPAAPLPTVAVTYSVLASVVRELVDGVADVVTIVPDGVDPHDFEPSARDVETLTNADFIVANGLHFESGLDSALEQLREAGRPIFYAIDHVTARLISADDDGHDHGAEHSDEHGDEHGDSKDGAVDGDGHDHGAIDVHLWTSPATLVDMVAPLAAELGTALSVDFTAAATDLTAALNALDSEILDAMATIPNGELVTGHNELGYFAERYGCDLIGTVIPSSTTTAEASAGQLAELKKVIAERSAPVIFTSLGTPRAVAEQIARESGVKVVELSTHVMGDAESYGEFMRRLATTIASALT
jgi:zinc/manganese transport system substrate-binding protein